MKKPKPKIELSKKVLIPVLHKSKFSFVDIEFNPQGAPQSNSWYYIPSFDKYRRLKEDYIIELLSGQLKLRL